MKNLWFASLVTLVLIAGCNEDQMATAPTPPVDRTAPAAPRGLVSVTGDTEAFLSWYQNTEGDVAGYRLYESPCADGPGCPYDRIGATTGTSFVVTGLTNGVKRYFAVAAYDHAGNEGPLSYENVNDTPRPEGFGRALTNRVAGPATAGYDFSAFTSRPWDDTAADVYFDSSGSVLLMVAPFADTDLQDAGYANSLDAVDYAPPSGWAPSGTVELIVGHCYVVRITPSAGVTNFAKFRVTSVNTASVVFDWAYQTAVNNGELRSHPARGDAPRVRRAVS